MSSAPASVPVDQVEVTLMELAGEVMTEPPRAGPGRPRILPASLLWMGMIVCVLQGWTSQRAVWRLLSLKGLWSYPRIAVSDEAVYKRLAQGGTAVLETFFAQISALLVMRLAPFPVLGCAALAPFAPAVVAMDRTTLDPVLRKLPTLRSVPTGDHELLPGSLHGLFDLRTQQWRTVRYTDHVHQNEKIFARELVATLPEGSLVLMDRGYFGFHLLDDLTDAGYRWIMRFPDKISTEVIHVHYQRGETRDVVAWLGVHRNDRAKHAVRLIEFRHGTTRYRYLTNVRDPALLAVADIARLYARRWDIEMAFRLIKEHLGLHLLWSAKPDVVLQQVWAVLIIAQILQAARLEIAGRAGVDPFDVSLPLLVTYLPLLAARGVDPIATIVAEGRQVEIIRPSRRKPPPDPGIDDTAIQRLPTDLPLERIPRYRHRPPPTKRKRK